MLAQARSNSEPRRTIVHVDIPRYAAGRASRIILTLRLSDAARNVHRRAAFVSACAVARRHDPSRARYLPSVDGLVAKEKQRSRRKTCSLLSARNLSACLSCPRCASVALPSGQSLTLVSLTNQEAGLTCPFFHLFVSILK